MDRRFVTPFPYPAIPAYPYPRRWRWPVYNQALANASLQANTGALAYSILPGVANWPCVNGCRRGCDVQDRACLEWCRANCRGVGWW